MKNESFFDKGYKKAYLELSNGIKLEGKAIGADVSVSGEMVFNTGMLGYSEAMTDPSYWGQILVFSFCLIGNYGIPFPENGDFFSSQGHESSSIKTQGIIVSDIYSGCHHHDRGISLEDWMKKQDVPGIAGIDTRYLVQTIRESGNLWGRIVPEGAKPQNKSKFEFLKHFEDGEYVDPSKFNLMPSVSTKERQIIGRGSKKVAVIDCGAKWNIMRMLIERGCEVEVLPWDTDFSTVKCDGWVISNGPGDPKNTADLVERIKKDVLTSNKPILGICLGHQLLALASGAKTKRLSHGHRSHNQPVFSLPDKKAYMSSQNHRYAVEKNSIQAGWELWFENANDDSVEGLKHKTKPFMSVQFHPEASSGPNDTSWIMDKLVGLL
ncbi:glutamine-hydrolyzing carbamoyl-phosphate synthase small subunit [Candidatus Endomicrobiellum devescovinae]|jgi:carbamoyl-phosphate synthase small subunit|uniref:glutamine-hydrolyzing carbamoyl-phosphate synthase small subunit n=1 Tax=Candidatus Endomicrobiellum devescovinae TaxID=3242322 RepID=UPI0028241A24|nr:glutamine-hydrolyzing carbamoyl-phosphate synthase small subunit [Endomicrobium sp.]